MITRQLDTSRDTIVGFISMIVTFGASDTFQKDLEPVAGYFGSVVGSIAISAIIVFVVCLFGKLSRSKALATATLLPPTLVTFEQIRRHSIELTGSGLLSLVLAIVSALAVGFVVALLVKRVTGVNWDPVEKADPAELRSRDDA